MLNKNPWNILEIDLSAIQLNFLKIRKQVSRKTPFYAVVKSDAYGHGLLETAFTLNEVGCNGYAVETPDEGAALRKAGINGEILLMNPIPDWIAIQAIENDLSVSVINKNTLQCLEQNAKTMKKKCITHIKVNLGLNRMGVSLENLLNMAKMIKESEYLTFKGLYAQPRDAQTADSMARRLITINEMLIKNDVAPESVHITNSASFLLHPNIRSLGIRMGILLYGITPPEVSIRPAYLKSAMSLYSKVVQLHTIESGAKVGYRAECITARKTRLAVIPLGYGHGLDRKLSKGGYVIIKGQKASFIGAISMNSSTIDVTDIPEVKIGTPVTIIGKEGEIEITPNTLAGISGTIAGEMITRLGKGISRTYKYATSELFSLERYNSKDGDSITVRAIKSNSRLGNANEELIGMIAEGTAVCRASAMLLSRLVHDNSTANTAGDIYIIFAEVNKALVGVAIIRKIIPCDGGNHIMELLLLYVPPDCRSKGIGATLLSHIRRKFIGQLLVSVPENGETKEFFFAMGFRVETSHLIMLKE